MDNVVKLMNRVSEVGEGNPLVLNRPKATFQANAYLDDEGSYGAFTVSIQVSNDRSNWLEAGTISVTTNPDEGAASDGFAINARWQYVRAVVTSSDQDGGLLDVFMGA